MNYAKLRGKIREIFGTQEAFAKAIGLSKSGVSMRLNGKVNWTAEEIERSKEALGFSAEEIGTYFFTRKV
nr:MAG TPA: Protein of unknown function (DUF739) [Caudoviricetes sp.]DAH34172.1 MAG TPA: Protein of unknown function (DUF739) [Caudoviricetes sp.]